MRLLYICVAALTALLLSVSCDRDEPGSDAQKSPTATPAVKQDAAPNVPVGEAIQGESAADETATDADAEDEPETDDADAAADNADESEAVEEEPATEAEATVAAEFTSVVLETTVGDITIEVHPEWAPRGAAQFLMLVGEGYYDGAPFFRVVPDFMAQIGFSGNHELTALYLGQGIPDDPVVMGNYKYTLSFGNSGTPESRSTHIFINFKDNNMLDTQGVPFPAFAKVVDGFDAVDNIYITGENPRELNIQGQLSQPGGINWFLGQYPDATVITKAYVVE